MSSGTLLQVVYAGYGSIAYRFGRQPATAGLHPTADLFIADRHVSKVPNYRPWPRTDARISSRLQSASVRSSLNKRHFVMTDSGITRRRILRGAATGGLAAAAASGAVGAARAQSARKTFVFVSGAFCGGWIWRGVTDRLEQGGHKVFAPSLTG